MFTAFQKKVLARSLTCAGLAAIGAFVYLAFKLTAEFLSVFAAAIFPVITALILSFILSPCVRFVSQKCRISAAATCIAVCAAFVAAAVALGAFAIPKAASDIAGLVSELPNIADSAARDIAENHPQTRDFLRENVVKLREYVAANVSPKNVLTAIKRVASTAFAATGGLLSIFSFAAAFAVVPIYLYYMLTSNFDFYAKVEKNLSFVKPQFREDLLFLMRRFAEIMATFFRGQLLIAVIMGVLYGAGLALAGVNYGFLLGFTAGLLNLVPYLGTMLGLGSILPVALFQADGGWALAAISLAVFCIVQCLEGYVLTPRIMGDRTGLHPTVIIFSVFFWGTAFGGILGMILAIPLTAFAVAAWDRIKMRIEKPAMPSK